MNNTQVLEETQKESVGQPASRWFATLTSTASLDLPGRMGRLVGVNSRSRTLYLGNEIDCAPPASAEHPDCTVIFDGVLFNRIILEEDLGEVRVPPNSDA